MISLVPRSVRARLWTAIALLSAAVLGVSISTWFALQRVDERMQELHQQSLSRVAQAIDLSKRSSDLATSAPYLLNQRSNFLIDQEGRKLITVLKQVRQEWPNETTGEHDEPLAVGPITDAMERAVEDLIDASKDLDVIQSQVREAIAKLGKLREHVVANIENPNIDDATRLIWWTLQSMNADALNAAYANNLIGVGEEQRHYQRQRRQLSSVQLTKLQTIFRDELENITMNDGGIFELRRQELAVNLEAQNALFRIRRDANSVNELAANYAGRAEAFLAQERSNSSSAIQFIRLTVAAISIVSLILAIAAALFVSRYVAFNISRVSEAMVRLATGDRSSALPRKIGHDDEIGDLFRSFRSFRANALRLDRSNRQLNQRNALFEKVFANIAYGIAITDVTGKITAFNPAFSRILSLTKEAPIKEPLATWFYGGKFHAAAKAHDLKISLRGQIELTADDGQVLELRASQLPDDGRVWLLADVTESQNLSKRLAQIDRIETLGKVAGDTAHDFANILSTIRTHSHLLKTSPPGSITKNLSAIENAVEFGSSLTERLLAFARKQNLAPETIELNNLLAGMIDLVEIGLKDDVELRVQYSKSELYVLADPGQLESTLLNLILNANNAIPDAGVIDVKLERSNDGEAMIVIKDNGIGMPTNVRIRAIEPFFSTRASEGGTGLGLSIVYGFIKQSGGNLEIDSKEGRGTKIFVTLPAVEPRLDVATNQDNRLALVVDDDQNVLNTVSSQLSSLDIKTMTCETISEALSLIDRNAFDLIISDFDLGTEINGEDFLQIVEDKLPQADRILMSGKSSLNENYDGTHGFIEKPITSEKLISAFTVSDQKNKQHQKTI
ncbi:MAG: ATP-binding protein [Lentilitoribacter sp.]